MHSVVRVIGRPRDELQLEKGLLARGVHENPILEATMRNIVYLKPDVEVEKNNQTRIGLIQKQYMPSVLASMLPKWV